MNIHYIGFSEDTGYGISAKLLVDALRKHGTKVFFTGIVPGNTEKGGTIVENGSEDESYEYVIIHTVPEYFPYWFYKEKKENSTVKVWGYTTWETDSIPDHWLPLLQLMDGLFVPGKINADVFRSCGVSKPIFLLPHISQFHGLCTNEASVRLQSALDKVSGRFLFYFIGTWSDRKAPWLIMDAFNDEFGLQDNVALLIKTGETDYTDFRRSWRHRFRKNFGRATGAFKKRLNKNKNPVIHITDEISDEEIASLHNHGDCFISLTRGEGWGIASYEAAWFGKPVIITGYGGMTDYLSAENSCLVDFELSTVRTNYGNKSYSKNQKWAEPDILHARKLMRHIYENQQEANQKGTLLKQNVMEKFYPDLIVKNCLEVLGFE